MRIAAITIATGAGDGFALEQTAPYGAGMANDGPPDVGAAAGIGLLTGLSPTVLRDVVAIARTRALPMGMRIFDQGEHAGRAHALLSGCVRISQAGSDGEEILVRFITPGEIFGCVPILTDGLYPADATAMIDSQEISWDPADLVALMQRHPDIAINMIAVIGKRLGEAQERLREVATQSVDRRIARTLLRLLDQAGSATDAGIRIGFPLRRKDIADIAGTTLHTASRILSGWQRGGLLISRNQALTITAPDDLRRIAEDGGG